jgi:hypothetical protein
MRMREPNGSLQFVTHFARFSEKPIRELPGCTVRCRGLSRYRQEDL